MLSLTNIGIVRGGKAIFRKLTFAVAAGESLQVIGRNGSGKTSLLKLLAGILEKNEGVLLKGYTPADIGYLGHKLALYPLLTVAENLNFFCHAGGQKPILHALLDAFTMLPLLTTRVSFLSRGQQQKIALARLCAQNAKLWLLDEPMTSLDKESKKTFLFLLQRHLDNQGTAIIAGHDEIASLNSQVVELQVC